MSNDALEWAFEQDVQPAPQKFVLVALADQANKKNECWPSVKRLSKRTGMSTRSVINHLSNLEQKGLIFKAARGGDGKGRKSNFYTLNMDQKQQSAGFSLRGLSADSAGGKVQDFHYQSATFAGLSADSSPKPSIEPSINHKSIHQKKQKSRFAEFWLVYPKKAGKKPTEAKWKKRKLDTIADILIADVKNRTKNHKPWLEGFIPNPLTYINEDRWEDEIQFATQTRKVPLDRSSILKMAAENGINTEHGLTMEAIRQKLADCTGMRL